MMHLPHQDHYERARDAALERARARFNAQRMEALGVVVRAEHLEVESLCWRFAVRLKPVDVRLMPEGEVVDIVWQILLLGYIGAEEAPPPRRFVSFADFAEGRGYQAAFNGRVLRRLERTVGRERETFVQAAARCGGIYGSDNPLTYLFRFFPRLELQVIRHEGDEEFPPSCQVLFPDNAPHWMPMENLIVAAERLVSSLEGKKPTARLARPPQNPTT